MTPKQKLVLEFILEFSAQEGYAPSQAEIAKHFGFSSLGTVQNYLVRLQKAGLLTKEQNARRGMRVTPVVREPVTGTHLPLVGKVAAGCPIEAIETQETIEVPQSLLGLGEHMVLEVSGDSMIEDGILEGDYVVIRKQASADNGQTVVALINNEATIKRYMRRPGKIELHPANPKYQPIIVGPEIDQFHIEGVMVGLIRKT